MAECIDLMHRTMIAVSEGRVVLPLRSLLAMPGDRGMLGIHAGLSRRSGMLRGQARQPDPAQQAAAIFLALGSGAVVRGGARPPVALLDAAEITAIRTAAASGLATGCSRGRMPGIWPSSGAGEQARSHLEAMLAVRRCAASACGRAIRTRRAVRPERGREHGSPSRPRRRCATRSPAPTSFARSPRRASRFFSATGWPRARI